MNIVTDFLCCYKRADRRRCLRLLGSHSFSSPLARVRAGAGPLQARPVKNQSSQKTHVPQRRQGHVCLAIEMSAVVRMSETLFSGGRRALMTRPNISVSFHEYRLGRRHEGDVTGKTGGRSNAGRLRCVASVSAQLQPYVSQQSLCVADVLWASLVHQEGICPAQTNLSGFQKSQRLDTWTQLTAKLWLIQWR